MGSPEAGAAGCIYCGRPFYDPDAPSRSLTREHIIPEGLGGALTLDAASCKICQDTTSSIESQCIRHLVGTARKDLKIFGKKAKPKAKIESEGKPTLLPLFRYSYPRILLGEAESNEPPSARAAIIQVTKDFAVRLAQVGDQHEIKYAQGHGGGLNALIFAHMLAKIGHAYVAKMEGRRSFQPPVDRLVRGIKPLNIGHYIGTEIVDDAPVATRFILSHAWESPIRMDDPAEYLVVRIRLFAEYVGPTYLAVVGRRPSVGLSY